MAGSIADRPVGRPSSALMRLTLTELKLFMRMRTGLVFSMGLPLLLLVILGSIHSFNQPRRSLYGYTLLDAYAPILIALVLAVLSLTALPMVLAGYRERGVLRRLQTTSAGRSRMLAAQLMVNLATTVVTVIMIFAVARLGFGVFLPR
jgi:ABC-2 type transport system permease protein